MCQREEDVYITLDERLEDAYRRAGKGDSGNGTNPDDPILELFK